MVEFTQNMVKEIKLTLNKNFSIPENNINLKAYREFEEAGEIENLKPGTFLAFINGLFIGMDHTLPGLESREEIENSPDVVFIKQVHSDTPPLEIRGEKFIESKD